MSHGPSDDACGFFASEGCVQFRPMTTADLDEVMVIERTAFPFPWSVGFFLQELQVACARSILAETGRENNRLRAFLAPARRHRHSQYRRSR